MRLCPCRRHSTRARLRCVQCDIYPDLKVLLDYPTGDLRLTYAMVVAGAVQAIAIFVEAEPVGRVPCFALGCAVIESMRGRGLAKEIVMKAMEELQKGLKRNRIVQFYVEAVAATSNVAFIRLARRCSQTLLALAPMQSPASQSFST